MSITRSQVQKAVRSFVPASESFAILRNDAFRKYFVGQTLSAMGDSLIPIALAFAVLDVTHSSAALGFVLLASRVPLTILALVGGVLGDRLPRRAIMVSTDVVRAVAHGTTAALLLTGQAKLWHLIVLQIIAGTASAFFTPAAAGLVKTVVADDRLREANALLGFSRSLSAILAIAISGSLIALIGPGWSFALNSLTFVSSVYYLAQLKLPKHETISMKKNFMGQLGEGFSYVYSQGWLLTMIIYTSFLNGAVIAPLIVLGPTMAKQSLGGATSWAAIQVATGVGAIVGSSIALTFKPRRALLGGLLTVLLVIPFCLLLAATAPVWLIAISAFFFGFQGAYFGVAFSTMMQSRVAHSAISRVTAYNSLGSLLFAPLGFALAGVFAARWGARGHLALRGGLGCCQYALRPRVADDS